MAISGKPKRPVLVALAGILLAAGVAGLTAAVYFGAKAVSGIEAKAFRVAEMTANQAGPASEHAVRAYGEFLKHYPDSSLGDEAKKRMGHIASLVDEERAFSKTEREAAAAGSDSEKTFSSWNTFLATHPNGRRAQEVASRLAKLKIRAPEMDRAFDRETLKCAEKDMAAAGRDIKRAGEILSRVRPRLRSAEGRVRLTRIESRLRAKVEGEIFEKARRVATQATSLEKGIGTIERFLRENPSSQFAQEARMLVADHRRRIDKRDYVMAEVAAAQAAKKNDLQAAKSAYEKYLNAHPDGSNAYAARAKVLAIRQKDVAGEARKVLKDPPKLVNRSARDSFTEGAKKLEGRKFLEAVKWFEAARDEKMSGKDSAKIAIVIRYAYFSEAMVLTESGEWSRCIKVVTEALRKFSGDPRLSAIALLARRENIPAETRKAFEEGRRLENGERYRDAEAAYRRAEGEANSHYHRLITARIAECRERLFGILYGEAKAAYLAGDANEAARTAKEALGIKPNVKFLERIVEETDVAKQ